MPRKTKNAFSPLMREALKLAREGANRSEIGRRLGRSTSWLGKTARNNTAFKAALVKEELYATQQSKAKRVLAEEDKGKDRSFNATWDLARAVVLAQKGVPRKEVSATLKFDVEKALRAEPWFAEAFSKAEAEAAPIELPPISTPLKNPNAKWVVASDTPENPLEKMLKDLLEASEKDYLTAMHNLATVKTNRNALKAALAEFGKQVAAPIGEWKSLDYEIRKDS